MHPSHGGAPGRSRRLSGGEPGEPALHPVDPGEVATDVAVAALLAGGEPEAALRVGIPASDAAQWMIAAGSCFCRSVAVTIRRRSRVRETSRSRSAAVSTVSG